MTVLLFFWKALTMFLVWQVILFKLSRQKMIMFMLIKIAESLGGFNNCKQINVEITISKITHIKVKLKEYRIGGKELLQLVCM